MPESPLDSIEDLQGKKVVFTGSMDRHTRDEIRDLGKELGATVHKSISNQTDILVVGDNPGQDKFEFAKENEISWISGEEFYSLLDASGNEDAGDAETVSFQVDSERMAVLRFVVNQSKSYSSVDELAKHALEQELQNVVDVSKLEG